MISAFYTTLSTFQDKPLIKFKSHLYYEEKDELAENLKALKPLPNSRISYFLNGKSLGTAFTDIYRGEYNPAAGLFKQGPMDIWLYTK